MGRRFRLKNTYLRFLYSLVGLGREDRPEYQDYWELLAALDAVEFVYFVDNDSNRLSDGIMLRKRYISECFRPKDLTETQKNLIIMETPCSVLEVLIALALRMNYEFLGDPDEPDRTCDIFFEMIENLDLWRFTDRVVIEAGTDEINEIVQKWLFREYDTDGNGGIFPLKFPRKDQRFVEIWGQMNAYIIEKTV